MSDRYKRPTDLGTFAVVDPFLVEVVTASKSLTVEDHKGTFLIGTDALVITLPATVAGLEFSFINIGAAGNNIITISPAAADMIQGKINAPEGSNADATTADGLVVVLPGTDDKDLINTKATADPGDRVTLIGDGNAGWYVKEGLGVWASE